MLRPTAVLACASLLIATAAFAAPRCGVFGTACLHLKDPDGRVRLEAFEGSIDGSKGTWDHSFSVAGQTMLMAHCTKARVGKCTMPKKGECAPTTVVFNGTCDLKVGSDPTIKGNFIATVVDHPACDSLPDTYAIVIRNNPYIGKGEIVHEASGPTECGGLRVSHPK